MKNRFIKILSVLGMSALLLVNGNVLFTAHAHEHFKREPGDPEVGGGCTPVATTNAQIITYTNMKNRFLARGCKKRCDYIRVCQKTDISIGL